MTELSWFWAGSSTGDAASVTDDDFSDFIRYIMLQDRAAQGPVLELLNGAEVTGTTSPVSVDTGYALVDGKPWRASASVDVAIPTPSTNPRIDRVVLRKDFSGQTIRVTRIAGTEAASPSAPALTQSDGTTWDVPLAQVYITTGGVITVTDEREFAYSPLSYLFVLLGGSGKITAKGQILGAKAADSLGVLAAASGDGRVVRSLASADTGLEMHNPIHYFEVELFSMRDSESAFAQDGVGFFRIPAELDGMNLVSVEGDVGGAGTTGSMDIMIRNGTTAHDMLNPSYPLSFASGATQDDGTAAINTSYDDVSTGDRIWIDCDVVHTTPATGCVVTLGFRMP